MKTVIKWMIRMAHLVDFSYKYLFWIDRACNSDWIIV